MTLTARAAATHVFRRFGLPKEGLTEYGGMEWRQLRQDLRKGVKVPFRLEEAEELIDDWERRGLWHIVMSRGRLPLIEAICNCEKRYCTYWMNRPMPCFDHFG